MRRGSPRTQAARCCGDVMDKVVTEIEALCRAAVELLSVLEMVEGTSDKGKGLGGGTPLQPRVTEGYCVFQF